LFDTNSPLKHLASPGPPLVKFGQLLGIITAGVVLGAIPATLLGPHLAEKMNSSLNKRGIRGGQIQDAFQLALTMPLQTATWWAGGASLFIGATKNEPAQMAAGAGLLALSSKWSSNQMTQMKEKWNRIFDIEELEKNIGLDSVDSIEYI
jgi:hypothetical protein